MGRDGDAEAEAGALETAGNRGGAVALGLFGGDDLGECQRRCDEQQGTKVRDNNEDIEDIDDIADRGGPPPRQCVTTACGAGKVMGSGANSPSLFRLR